jgi:hypothetical protein
MSDQTGGTVGTVEHAPAAPPARAGHHRRRARVWRPAALVVAVAAAVTLLWLPPVSRPAPPGELTLAGAWPKAKPVDVPGSVPDGPTYSPLLFLDGQTSVGTAASPDGRGTRLLLRAPDGKLRQLRYLRNDASPQYGGLAFADDILAWAESTAKPDGTGRTTMWAVNWRSGAAPRELTADTGDAVFFNSEYDTMIADGQLHWAAVAPQEQPATEIRSVPLTGGKVTVRVEQGAWSLSTWPWLASAGSSQTGPVQLRDPVAGKRLTAPAEANELVTCQPSWCRVLVLSSGGPAQVDLMRPDGSDRQKMAGSAATAALSDVALLDRFEVLTRAGKDGSPTSSSDLLLYDVKRKRTVRVGTGVGMVLARAGVLWWSTGDDTELRWHALDLHTLD